MNNNEVILEGFHACKHAMRFGAEVTDLVTACPDSLTEMLDRHAPDIKNRMLDQVRVIDAKDFAGYSNVQIRTPLAGKALKGGHTVETIEYSERPIVLLENPKSHDNIGAVVRTAAGMGAAAVITTGSTDPWHKNAVRTSQGLHFALPVIHVSEGLFDVGVGFLSDNFNEEELYVFDEHGEDLQGVTIPHNAILCFGSERQGVTVSLRERAHKTVRIPQVDGVSSYNLAVSVAMGLYHQKIKHAGL